MSNLDLDICYLSASEALEKFKNKSLSPVELLTETIKKNFKEMLMKASA